MIITGWQSCKYSIFYLSLFVRTLCCSRENDRRRVLGLGLLPAREGGRAGLWPAEGRSAGQPAGGGAVPGAVAGLVEQRRLLAWTRGCGPRMHSAPGGGGVGLGWPGTRSARWRRRRDAAAPDDEDRRSSVNHGGSSPEKKKSG